MRDNEESADLRPVDKLKSNFEHSTNLAIAAMEKELALLKAMGDEAAAVKQYIKIGMLKHAQELFATAYFSATRPEQSTSDLRQRLSSGAFPQNRSER